MKRLLSLLCAAALAIAFVSCDTVTPDNGGNNNNGSSVTQHKIMVDIPKSLTASSSASASIAGKSFNILAAEAPSSGSSVGYFIVQSAIGMIKDNSSMAAEYSVLWGQVISQNNLSTSNDTHTGLNITVTQEMVDAMKASVPAEIADLVETPEVGSSMPVPDFVYKASTNANFDYEVVMTMEMPAEMGGNATQTFYWKEDRSRFGVDMSLTGLTMTMAYDEATKSNFFKIVASGMTYAVSLVEDADSTVNGAFVKVVYTGEGYNSTIIGYADDNGGEVIDTETEPTPQTITEDFSATGELTYQKFNTDAPTVGTDPNATYSAKLDPVPTSFGAAAGYFAD